MTSRRGGTAFALLLVAGILMSALPTGCSDDDATGTDTGTAQGADGPSSASTTSAGPGTPPPTTATPPVTVPAATPTVQLFETVCGGAPRIIETGTVASTELSEISGLAASRSNPDTWWAHNDSGDTARIFALDSAGELLATVELEGARAVDWEDMAIGPPVRDTGEASLYLADIGDNAGVRDSVRVYRLAEPELVVGDHDIEFDAAADRLTFAYPDGPHDAEALLVDPIDGDLLVVTKDWTMSGTSGVYRAPAGLRAGTTTTLEHVATLALPVGTLVSGGDVSPDGSVVALRSYGAVTLHRRPPGQPLWAAFDSAPCEGPVPTERQGEAIAFAADGASYTTVSEGERPVLHRTVG